MALDGVRYAKAGAALRAAGGDTLSRESYLAEHLPFISFAGNDVMVLREGDLMATLRLDGLNPLTTPDTDLDALKRAVAAVISQTGNAYGIYVHRISVPQVLDLPPVPGTSFAAEIDRRWQSHIAGLAPKKKQLYLSIIRRPDLGARLPLLNVLGKGSWIKDRAARTRELNEVTGFFETALKAARPVRLTRENGEWLGYLGTTLSGQYAPIAAPVSPLPLAYCLGTVRTTFDRDTAILTCATTGQRRFGHSSA